MTSLIKRLLPAEMHFMPADDYEETTFLLYVWALELLQTREFGDHIRTHQRENSSKILWDKKTRPLFSRARNNLFNNFDIVRLKLATVKAVVLRISNQADAEAHFRRERLPADCADLYMYLLKDPHFWPLMRENMKLFNDPLLMQDMVLDPDKLIRECGEDFKKGKLDNKISFKVQRKLRFIANSNNTTLDEFEQEIKINAVSYYYKVRPFKTRLHARNYAIRSITGKINQIIDWSKHPERARLKEEHGGWKNEGNAVVISTGDFNELMALEGHNGMTWVDWLSDLDQNPYVEFVN